MNEIAWHMYTSVDCTSRVTGSSVSLAVEILRKNDTGEGKRSLRNGMWHGLRKDIIMGNVKYGQWRKETNKTEKHLCRALFLAPIWVSNCFAVTFITAGSNQQGRAESSDKVY